jgi:ABC-2 type transport system permease protein
MLQLITVSLSALIKKEFTRIIRIWPQTLLPAVVTQSLYFVIFGGYIGSLVVGFEQFGGYMGFLVPGIIMMAVITASYSNVVSSFFGAKFQRTYEEILVSPNPNWVILLGYSLGGVMRGLMVGGLVFLVSLFMVRPLISNIFIILLFTILTSTAFAFAGFLNSLFAKNFDDVTIVPTFVLTPLTYLGGVFYSIDKLPPVWQGISKFNPIVYMIDGFRYGFYGISTFSIWFNIAVLLGLNVFFFVLNWVLINRGYGIRK